VRPVLSDDTVAGFLEFIYGRTKVRYLLAEPRQFRSSEPLCRVVW